VGPRGDGEPRADFPPELRDAIEASNRLIAVIGPSALSSSYVRVEWDHAFLFSTCILPVLRKGDFLSHDDSDARLRAIARLHAVDFRESRPYADALVELLRLLQQPVPALAAFRTSVPSLPAHFLPRPEDLDQLATLVLADVQAPVVITSKRQTTALQGMGGIGKSVLSAVFARSTQARRAFGDGIVWLTAGFGVDPHFRRGRPRKCRPDVVARGSSHEGA
jgi:hypothetical protein